MKFRYLLLLPLAAAFGCTQNSAPPATAQTVPASNQSEPAPASEPSDSAPAAEPTESVAMMIKFSCPGMT